MTLAQAKNPSSFIEAKSLDSYLSKGWFRMGQTIFTTHFLYFDSIFYSAVWLRIPLEELTESKTMKKLKKTNEKFRVVFQPVVLTEEKELLFEKYKQEVSFVASASLHQLLLGPEPANIVYNSFEICLYDEDLLIGVGFFDLGHESAAGISSFYDPAYKKYSLGKYLIHLKIDYCKKLNLRYFYPGYFVPGYPAFDYKLEIGGSSLQYFSMETQQWLSISDFSSSVAPLEKMRTALKKLEELMKAQTIETELFYYEFYNANLIPEFKGLELFDFPIFLYCFDIVNGIINPIVVYNLRDQRYHLLQCESLYRTESVLTKGEHYSCELLKIDRYIYSTEVPEEMANVLQKNFWTLS
jgi:arginyl-tRNA--protein-N-Asp/Glu arginylyltransferase